MSATMPLRLRDGLPWSRSPDEERRFRIIVGLVSAVALVAALVVPLLETPQRSLFEADEATSRFARFLAEERPVPPPPPPPPIEEPAPVEPPPPVIEAPAPEPPPPAESAPEPVPQPVPEAVPDDRAAARERASRSGLLALSEELAMMRSEGLAQDLEQRPLQSGNASPPPEVSDQRVIIGSRAGAGSGGIDDVIAGSDRDTQLEGRQTTRVQAPVEAATAPAPARERPALPARTSEEIQRVFDQNRAALNTLYNRALRNDPTLAGTVVLRLTIVPSGDVTECVIVSSELADEDLERRLVARVRQFKFVAKQVAPTTITYPIDFFPG